MGYTQLLGRCKEWINKLQKFKDLNKSNKSIYLI